MPAPQNKDSPISQYLPADAVRQVQSHNIKLTSPNSFISKILNKTVF